MIPVKPYPEPDFFDKSVRIPGNSFLKQLSSSKPTGQQWKQNNYWTCALPELIRYYHRICSYYAHWIPSGACFANVDHYIPKSVRPDLAYEWSNYRLASPQANTWKSYYTDVLDPFVIKNDWFILKFPSLMVKPNPELPTDIQKQIFATIKRLKINDDQSVVDERSHWLKWYCLGAPFSFLKENAPFVAYELKRQNLLEDIKTMM